MEVIHASATESRLDGPQFQDQAWISAWAELRKDLLQTARFPVAWAFKAYRSFSGALFHTEERVSAHFSVIPVADLQRCWFKGA